MGGKVHEKQGWNYLRKKYRIMEYIAIAVITICVVVGIISDICVSNGHVWHGIKDIDAFSLTLLQIQAGISTLTIALVALISGNISDEYMGVSISDYYLNIRPVILKQKTIIIGAMGLLFINVALHQWNLYNLVICLFWVTGILILVSIIELYALFRGKSVVMQEIEDYILYILDGNYVYEKKRDIFKNFSISWVTQNEKQSYYEYEQYLSVFKCFIESLLTYKNNQCIQDIEIECVKISHCFLCEEKVQSCLNGINFIQDIYEKMWIFVRDNDVKSLNIEARFNVFGQVVPELQKSMKNMATNEVEECLNWKCLSDDIARVVLEFNYNSEPDDVIGELENVINFSRFLGYYLKERKNRYNEENVINHAFWGEILKTLYFSVYNVSDSVQEIYLLHKIKLYFAYSYGLVINDLGFIVKEYLYFNTMSQYHYDRNKYFDLLCISMHCYLYYLGKKEGDDCVLPEIKNVAKEIIEDNRIKNIFKCFLYNSFSRDDGMFETDIEKAIYNLVSRYEMFPKYANAKTMIMQDVVQEFYVFMVLYCENLYYFKDILPKALKNEMNMYYSRFLGEKESHTKEVFTKLYMLVESGKTKEAVSNEVNLLYNKFENYILKRYKEEAVTEAEQKQKEYIENVDEKSLIRQIKEQTYAHISNVFEPIVDSTLPKKNVMKIRLLRCSYLTDRIQSENINGFFSSMDGVLVSNLIAILLKIRAVSEKNRRDFLDDIEYIQTLKNKDINMLIGSEFILKNQDYKMKKDFDKYTESCTCIFTGGTNAGLALKEGGIKFSIQDVNVSIHPMTFQESDSEYDSNQDKYIYKIKGNVPAYFEKDELKTYIFNERKILDVSIKVTLTVKEKDIGYVFHRGWDES